MSNKGDGESEHGKEKETYSLQRKYQQAVS